MLVNERYNQNFIKTYSSINHYILADGVWLKEDIQPIETVDKIDYEETDIPIESEVEE